MDIMASIMSLDQKQMVTEMLDDEAEKLISIEEWILPKQLASKKRYDMVFSFLIQSGYLSLEEKLVTCGKVTIPNPELKNTWRQFLMPESM